MIPSSVWRSSLWVGLIALLFAGTPAWAANPCKGLTGKAFRKCLKEAKKTGAITFSVNELDIQSTGISAIDDVFEPLKEVIEELRTANQQLQDAQLAIGKAIGVNGCEPLSKGVAAFGQKMAGSMTVSTKSVKIALISKEKLAKIKASFEAKGKKVPPAVIKSIPQLNFPMPQLESTRDSSQVRRVVKAVNEAVYGSLGVVKTTASVPLRIQKTVAAASVLPVKAPRAIKNAQLTKEQAQDALVIMQENLMVTLGLPKLALSTLNELKTMMMLVRGLSTGQVADVPQRYDEIVGMGGFTYRRLANGYVTFSKGQKSGCIVPSKTVDGAYQNVMKEFAGAGK